MTNCPPLADNNITRYNTTYLIFEIVSNISCFSIKRTNGIDFKQKLLFLQAFILWKPDFLAPLSWPHSWMAFPGQRIIRRSERHVPLTAARQFCKWGSACLTSLSVCLCIVPLFQIWEASRRQARERIYYEWPRNSDPFNVVTWVIAIMQNRHWSRSGVRRPRRDGMLETFGYA